MNHELFLQKCTFSHRKQFQHDHNEVPSFYIRIATKVKDVIPAVESQVIPGLLLRNIFRQQLIRLGYFVPRQHKDFHQWRRDERTFFFRLDSPLDTKNYSEDHNEILCPLLFYLSYHSYSEYNAYFRERHRGVGFDKLPRTTLFTYGGYQILMQKVFERDF